MSILQMAEPQLRYQIKNLSVVCKTFYAICHIPVLWRQWSLTNVGCVRYTKDSAKSIFEHAEHFRYFFFGGDYYLFDSATASEYLKRCCNLVSLDIGSNGLLTDLLFVRGMPKLKRLILDYCHEISPDSIIEGLRKTPYLEYLSMMYCQHLDIQDVLGLAEFLPKLRVLNIEHSFEINHEDLHVLLTNMKSLQQLQATPSHLYSELWFPVMVMHAKVHFGVALRETLTRQQQRIILLSKTCHST